MDAETRAATAAAGKHNAPAAAAQSDPNPAGVAGAAHGTTHGEVAGKDGRGSSTGADAFVEAARAEHAELKDTIASLRGQLDSAQREAFADKERMFADVADAQGELALEADRRAAFEREVAALRERLLHQQDHREVNKQSSSLAQLQAVCAKQAEDLATAVKRAGAAEQELAGARTSIEEVTGSARDLQGRLDLAESKLHEHARETAAAQARAESAERETAEEAEKERTQLQRRLRDAENRAASLGEELEAALRAKVKGEVQAAGASEAAAAVKVSCWRVLVEKTGCCREGTIGVDVV